MKINVRLEEGDSSVETPICFANAVIEYFLRGAESNEYCEYAKKCMSEMVEYLQVYLKYNPVRE